MKIFRHFKIQTNRFVYKDKGPSYQYSPELGGVEAGANKEMADIQKGIEDQIDKLGADPTEKVATQIADKAVEGIYGVCKKIEQTYPEYGDSNVIDSKIYVDRITMNQSIKARATEIKDEIESAKVQYLEREKSLEAAAAAEGIVNVVDGDKARVDTQLAGMNRMMVSNFKGFKSLDDLSETGEFRSLLVQLNNSRDLFVPIQQGYAQCADIIKDITDPAIKEKYSKLIADIEVKNQKYTELVNVKFPEAYAKLLKKGKVQIQKTVKLVQDEIERLNNVSSSMWTKIAALEVQGKTKKVGQMKFQADKATQELNDFKNNVPVEQFENFQRRLAKVPPMEGVGGGGVGMEDAPIRVAKAEKAPAKAPDAGKKG